LRTNPSTRCVLIGHGMDASNLELAALLRRHGVAEHVILLGRRDDGPALMNGLDIHVLSSRAEGFPNVVAEAMATGVLCVVTDVGDAAAMVDDTGWIVPSRNAAALAGAIDAAVAVLDMPERLERAERGRRRVEDLYSLQAMVDNYHVVWRRLAQDFPARRPHTPEQTYGAWSLADSATALRRAGRDGVGGQERGAQGGWAASGADGVAGKRLLMVVNNPAFFLSHRLPVAL